MDLRNRMYRRITIYELFDENDMQDALDTIIRNLDESMIVRKREIGFDLERVTVSMILDFDTLVDCDAFTLSKENINLAHQMPAVQTESTVAYYVDK